MRNVDLEPGSTVNASVTNDLGFLLHLWMIGLASSKGGEEVGELASDIDINRLRLENISTENV